MKQSIHFVEAGTEPAKIQAVIDNARPGDVVRLAEGRYKPGAVLFIKPGVSILHGDRLIAPLP